MADPNVLNPHTPEFDRFLYASVGEDRNGSVVTVLSTLARLGLDPWNETADLVTLGRDAAGVRLGQLLSGFHDVPALGRDHPKVARELSQLLPESAPVRGPTSVVSSIASGRSGSSGGGWAIFVLLFILLQMLFIVGAGPGE